MSDKIGSRLTSDNDDINAKALMTFVMELLHFSQWKLERQFGSGSHFEIGYSNSLLKMYESRADKLDVDRMKYNRYVYAFPRSASIPETYAGDIIRIYTDDVHNGYARLIREKDNIELMLFHFVVIKDGELRHGPAVQKDFKDFLQIESFSLKNSDEAHSYKYDISFFDVVWAVHSPYWPVEATEWITRRRIHRIPSKSVIKQVIKYGCDFVKVSHNILTNDGEWRFSFSKAELIIIKSLASIHRIIYLTLWMLNKKAASKNLCSYYFKIILLWACEEKPTQFWRNDLLVHSVCELVIQMMQCIKSKSCLNYFIPGNNMMDHLIDLDLSFEMDALWRTLHSLHLISNIINTYRQVELPKEAKIYCFELPAWLKRAEIICQRVANNIDSYKHLLSTDLTTDLQNALYIELSNIYKGLYFQQKFTNCAKAPGKSNNILKAECNLIMAANLCESQSSDVMDYCSTYFINTLGVNFKSCGLNVPNPAFNGVAQLNTKCRLITADRLILLNDNKEQNTSLYDRYVNKYKNKLANSYSDMISEGRKVNISLSVRRMNKPQKAYNWICFFKELPGRSPTVNISWFIAKAYLANLYYAIQRDISLIINTCDDIIDVYRQSHKNLQFAENMFPVILSTQWTNVYDNEIQELLGFYSLGSYVFDASIPSVYIGVCPVQFALYLKLRTCKFPWSFLIRVDNLLNDWLKQYNEHSKSCKYNSAVNHGRFLLNRSLANSQKTLRYLLSNAPKPRPSNLSK